jgi:hypothetical protein
MRAVAVLLAAWAEGQSPPPKPSVEEETLARLVDVRRLYVDRFGGGDTAAQLRDMIISSLQATKLFVITENEERADAFLRGSAEDLVFTDTFSSSEGISARASLGAGADPDKSSSDRRSRYSGVSISDQESVRRAERKHEASASVRIVGKDGDVLWSTTQESLGGKFRGASADVADKITRQLVRDHERARMLQQAKQK